ncbi:universal stress protein [Paenibacillus sp. H1-7]|uniref:universal stress protein n=1 Tax=Paenibacillus sp. H1-7 TaxID=2282849 RepID=UPI001EF851DE|nr:universal stress protein [Paenibacillus sp. H1-7]ULL13522.1 universal stress protein [Paenibacillus sp. H1-7]
MLFSNILVAYDGSDLSKKALIKAVEIVKETSSHHDTAPKLDVLHIVQDVSYVMGTAVTIDPKLIQAVVDEARQLVPAEVEAEFLVEYGQPALTILKHADDKGSDLILMGSRGLGPIRELFLGSVSHNVVQNAKLPVLIVK